MAEFDSPWKEALDVYFEPFLAFFLAEAHADIDWNRGYEFLDKELQKIVPESETGRRTVDKLVKVWRRDGEEEWVLIHIEVQSQPETDFPLRMYRYHYRLFDRYNRQVVSLAILGDDCADWRPDRFGYNLWSCSVQLQFPAVKLLDYVPRWEWLESRENPFAIIVMAHLKSLETRRDVEARRGWKVRLLKNLYARGMNSEEIRKLLRFIDWLMALPPALEARCREELAQYEEKGMPYITSFERLGIRDGLLMGIEAILDLKFGEEGLTLLPEIRQLYNHETLEVVLRSIKTAGSLEDFQRTWSEIKASSGE